MSSPKQSKKASAPETRKFTVQLPNGETIETDKPCVAVPFTDKAINQYIAETVEGAAQ